MEKSEKMVWEKTIACTMTLPGACFISIRKQTRFSWLSGMTFGFVIAIGLLMERHPDPDLTVGSMDAMKDKTRE